MPGLDGVEVLRQLRTESDVYVIMLTARAEEVDKLVGLAVGADDYVTKPFSPRELVARIKAVLRRGRSTSAVAPDQTARRSRASVSISPRRALTRDGVPVELSALEFDLLVALARAPWSRAHPPSTARTSVGLGTSSATSASSTFTSGVSAEPSGIRPTRRSSSVPSEVWATDSSESPSEALASPRCSPVRFVRARRRSSFWRHCPHVRAPGAVTVHRSDPQRRRRGQHGDRVEHRAFVGALWSTLPIALAVSAAAAALVTAFVARQILRPIAAVRRATSRLAAGRYDERVAEPAALELAALAGDVNRLADALQHTEARRGPVDRGSRARDADAADRDYRLRRGDARRRVRTHGGDPRERR